MPATARKQAAAQKPERKQLNTAVRIPRPLYEEARCLVGQSSKGALTELVTESLREKLHALRRQRIDDAFAGMATDEKYQKETMKVAREFEASDWHAFRQSEGKGK